MDRQNVMGVESLHGLKTLEFVCGDVTSIACDLLAVSAFRRGYTPTPGSVPGALWENHGFSLQDASITPAIDLREPFGIWVTPPIDGRPFGRVICVEMTGQTADPAQALENLFVGLAVLEAKGVPVTTLALPLLGTGNQGISPTDIVGPLIAQATTALRHSRFLQKVVLVAWKIEDAALVSQEMDRQLGTVRASLPHRDLVSALLSELRAVANEIRLSSTGLQQMVAMELMDVVSQERPSAADIGLVARRMTEVITDSMAGGRPGLDLFRKIENLAQKEVSPWVISYLHTLRVIGNEVVHIRDGGRRNPAHLADEDVAVCLFCLLRVARFWQDFPGR